MSLNQHTPGGEGGETEAGAHTEVNEPLGTPADADVKLAAFPKGFFDALVAEEMPLFEWLDLAATLDVDGVELYSGFFKSLERDYINKVDARLSDLGLEMPMLCHSPDFTQADPKARQAEVDRTRRMMDLTATLGGKYCRVLSGQRRPEIREDEGMAWVIESIEALLPHAEKTGVVLTLENHYKDGTWQYPEFAQSMDRFLRILNAVSSPWLKVQYDPSNAVVAGDDPYELLEKVVARVATMHASDRYLEGGDIEDLKRLDKDPQHGYAPMLRHGVIGEGMNDFDRIFKTLVDADFSGWVSIEDGEGDTIEEGMENLRKSVLFLRNKMNQYFG